MISKKLLLTQMRVTSALFLKLKCPAILSQRFRLTRNIPAQAGHLVRQQAGAFLTMCIVQATIPLFLFLKIFYLKFVNCFPENTFTLVEMNARKHAGRNVKNVSKE